MVDDERDIREVIRIRLVEGGYEVLEAENGRAALEIISNLDIQIDLLISDVLMPSMHGNELVKRARSIRPNLKAMFISGHSEHILGQLTLVPENAPFLQKPIKNEQLLSMVQTLILHRLSPSSAPEEQRNDRAGSTAEPPATNHAE